MMYSLKIAACILAVAALLGCISMNEKSPQTKEQFGKSLNMTTGVPPLDLITAGGDDNISVVTVRSTNKSGKWLFPAQDYDDEFLFAGLHSDSFMMLNHTQIRWLDDNEAIWLTLMRWNGSGVLFNAVYSNRIATCNASGISILGKEYPLSQLKNGSSFLNDDKWKVAVESENGCAKRVIIYLDGYFDGLKESDQIPLFRNDNTILLQFGNLASEPEATVIGTRPPESFKVKMINETILPPVSITDAETNMTFIENQTLNESGLQISFMPPIPICDEGQRCETDRYYPDDFKSPVSTNDPFYELQIVYWGEEKSWENANTQKLTSSHRVLIDIMGDGWTLAAIRYGAAFGDDIVLGKESGHAFLSPYSCSNETIESSGRRYGFGNFSFDNSTTIELIDPGGSASENIVIGPGDIIDDGRNGSLKIWKLLPGYTFCSSSIEVSTFSKTVEIEGDNSVGSDSPYIDWSDTDYFNASLKSLFIPRPSPIFEKLTG